MRALRLAALGPAMLLGLSCGGDPFGGAPQETFLMSPGGDHAVGLVDRESGAYLFFDGRKVDVSRLNARHDAFVDPMGLSPVHRAPRPHPPGQDALEHLSPHRHDVMRCWEVTYGTNSGAVFCIGCCSDETCTEDCTDLRPDADTAALREWRSLDPIPPDRSIGR